MAKRKLVALDQKKEAHANPSSEGFENESEESGGEVEDNEPVETTVGETAQEESARRPSDGDKTKKKYKDSRSRRGSKAEKQAKKRKREQHDQAGQKPKKKKKKRSGKGKNKQD